MAENELKLPTPGNVDAHLIEPEDANITIRISTDTRQTGTMVLAEKLVEFLQKEGYTNVQPLPFQTPPWDENKEVIAIQKRVKITLDLPHLGFSWPLTVDKDQEK